MSKKQHKSFGDLRRSVKAAGDRALVTSIADRLVVVLPKTANQREAIEMITAVADSQSLLRRVERAIEYCEVMQPSERLHQVRKILDPDFSEDSGED